MRLFLLLLLVCSQAFAMDWSDLEVGKSYKLSQSFSLKQNERSGALLEVTKGESVELKALIPLSIPGAALVLYIFDYKACPGPELTTDQEIIPVERTSPVAEVGFLLDLGCELNVYLELKDYYSNSLFE